MRNLGFQNNPKEFNSLDLFFIKKKISLLRTHYECNYLSEEFAEKLQKVHQLLSKVIWNNSDASWRFTSLKPEQVSNNIVGYCLEGMEELLQDLIDQQKFSQSMPSHVLSTLRDLSEDFYNLASYVHHNVEAKRLKKNGIITSIASNNDYHIN